MKNPITKLTAAAALVMILIALNSFNSEPAWARVVKAFNEAPDVHVLGADILDQGMAVNHQEAWIKNQNLFRMETTDCCIIDDGKRVLTLYKNLGIAHLRDSFTPYWDYTPVILKVFHDGQSADGVSAIERPGERTETADVYSIDFRGQWTGTAWVDRLTNLPVRVKGQRSRYVGRAKAFEISFDYRPIDETLFTTSVPRDFRELPNPLRDDDDEPDEDPTALAGTVIDPQGHPVENAWVFASYAAPGQSDAQGAFALPAPPTDGSRSIGPADLPMFVWAYSEKDPLRVAWTVIRWPLSDESDDPNQHVEKTHQGVVLVIKNEADFLENLPGSPGHFGENNDMEGDPQIADVVLVMGPAGTITGQVTDANGVPLRDALVVAETLELTIGSNVLTVTGLDEEWKAGFLTGTDENGNYHLGHLPSSWTQATLVVQTAGHKLVQQSVLNAGPGTVCNITIGQTDPNDR